MGSRFVSQIAGGVKSLINQGRELENSETNNETTLEQCIHRMLSENAVRYCCARGGLVCLPLHTCPPWFLGLVIGAKSTKHRKEQKHVQKRENRRPVLQSIFQRMV